eukprot:5595-Heterococcus_DN1.PRE.1
MNALHEDQDISFSSNRKRLQFAVVVADSDAYLSCKGRQCLSTLMLVGFTGRAIEFERDCDPQKQGTSFSTRPQMHTVLLKAQRKRQLRVHTHSQQKQVYDISYRPLQASAQGTGQGSPVQ